MDCCCQKCCEPCSADTPFCHHCGHDGRAYRIASARHMYQTAPTITNPPTKVIQFTNSLRICRDDCQRAILSSNCYGTGNLGVDNSLAINGVHAIDFAGIIPGGGNMVGKPLEQVLYTWPPRDVTHLILAGDHQVLFQIVDWGIVAGWTEVWLVIT